MRITKEGKIPSDDYKNECKVCNTEFIYNAKDVIELHTKMVVKCPLCDLNVQVHPETDVSKISYNKYLVVHVKDHNIKYSHTILAENAEKAIEISNTKVNADSSTHYNSTDLNALFLIL